jgi:glycosyltransferase involved in cell wall biosynthesis
MNPDSLMHCHQYYRNGMFDTRFTIGYWVWELQEFPEAWCSAFQLVNEVWVPSTFILDSVTRVSKLPVVRIPHPIDMPLPVPVDRSGFGLPKDRFLFLVMFDAHSMQDRKNPIGAIDAFLKAFGPEDSSVGLVIKAYNIAAFPEEKEKLVSKIEGRSNIYLLEDIMDKHRVNTLIHSTDAFISLHRSEGFGLVMAEAMYLGKPVMATHWSGNTDFMNAKNSCPVQYELVQIGKDVGPYKAHQIWAEPDLEHAAYSMRKLVLDHNWRKTIAAGGQQTVHQTLSPRAVGGLIRQRLSRLQLI